MSEKFRGAWIILPVILLDRLTKSLAQKTVNAELLPGVLRLRLIPNTGAAFSILYGGNLVLTIISIVLIAALILWMDKLPVSRMPIWLIIGGALGNVYDRIVYGSVIDFIDLEFVNFAVFNIADACIVAGAALALISMLIREKQGK